MATSEKWNSYIPKSFDDLKNFYMCGQWTESLGGVPIAAQTGKNVIRLLCKENKLKFKK
jgi:phytoene dehydrogenase-like protein